MRAVRLATTLLILSLLVTAAPAAADEIADQIRKGLKLYEQGDLSAALGEFEFAMAQMRQKKAAGLAAVFPPAPAGWEAGRSDSQSAGAAMLGGGISATQTYQQSSGEGQASIQVMTDSPLIASMAMLLSNPMLLQGGDNGRLIRVGGQKAVLKSGDREAELQMLVDGKILVTVEVSGVDGADRQAQDLAEAMDLKKLRSLAG